MNDLIRAGALLTSEDDGVAEEFGETVDPEKPIDDENDDDMDMSNWEN